MRYFWCQEYSDNLLSSDDNNFSLYVYSKFNSVISVLLGVNLFHVFSPFLNSAAVKTLKCLSDVFLREIFINGLRSKNMSVFRALEMN